MATILKIWFGQPITLENWYKKNQLSYKGVIARVNQVEAKLAELSPADKEQIGSKPH